MRRRQLVGRQLAILPSLGLLPESLKFLRVLRVTKMFRYSKNLTMSTQ